MVHPEDYQLLYGMIMNIHPYFNIPVLLYLILMNQNYKQVWLIIFL